MGPDFEPRGRSIICWALAIAQGSGAKSMQPVHVAIAGWLVKEGLVAENGYPGASGSYSPALARRMSMLAREFDGPVPADALVELARARAR